MKVNTEEHAWLKAAPSAGGAGGGAAAAAGGEGSEISRSSRSPIRFCCGGGCPEAAAAEEEEGSPPVTGALLSMLGEAAPPEPSSVACALPLPSEGAGACAARVTKPCVPFGQMSEDKRTADAAQYIWNPWKHWCSFPTDRASIRLGHAQHRDGSPQHTTNVGTLSSVPCTSFCGWINNHAGNFTLLG